MKWAEQRDLLLAKAAEDEKTMTVLIADAESPNASIGFHAQQAVEKYLKALLCHFQVSHRKTHDLVELMDQWADAGHGVPPEVDKCKHLQPYAVQFRYDNIPVGAPAVLDRPAAAAAVAGVRAWVMGLIAGGGGTVRTGAD